MITHLDLAELTIGPAPYHREGWLYELKGDGYRMLASDHAIGRKSLAAVATTFPIGWNGQSVVVGLLR